MRLFRMPIGRVSTWVRFSRKDRTLSAAIAMFYFLNVLCTKGRTFIPLPKLTMNLILYGVTALMVLIGIQYLKKQEFLMLFLGETIFGASFFYTFILDNLEPSSAQVYMTLTMIACVPFFVFIAAIDDLECLYHAMKVATFPSLVVLIRCYQIIYRNGEYDIKFSYLVLMCAVLHFNAALNRERYAMLYWFLGVMETVMIVTMGSRGALLCIIIFLALKITTLFGESNRAKLIALGSVVLMLLLMLSYRRILTASIRILNRAGIYSRTLDMMRTNVVLDDSGRSVIFRMGYRLIRARPVLGYGPAGEVPYIGSYVHNLFLELLIDFGIIVGFVLILVVVRRVLLYFSMRDRVEKDMARVFLATGFFSLMFSDSYLQNPYFFLYLGLTLRHDRRRLARITEMRRRAFSRGAPPAEDESEPPAEDESEPPAENDGNGGS